jgi:hypothetical protein
MNGSLLLALAFLAQPGMTRVDVFGREIIGLRNYEDVIRGTCDGRPASAIITKAYHGQRGRLLLRSGRWAREVPPAFLNGAAFTSGLQSLGLACDGQSLQLHALAIHPDAQGELVMDIQNATLDLRTGALTMTELRTLSPAETRSELGGR